MSEAKPIVYLIDDDVSVREGLSSLIRSTGIQVETFPSALEFLEFKRPNAPACLVLDVRMPGLGGMELQPRLSEAGDSIPIIFITGHGDIPMTVRAIKNGAIDFLAKPFTDKNILNAIAQALERDRHLRSERDACADLVARYDSLTPRELQVIPGLNRGMLNKQIAMDLGISEATVKVHRRNVMLKMGAKSLPELVRKLERIAASRSAAASSK